MKEIKIMKGGEVHIMNRKFNGRELNPNNWLSAIYIKKKKDNMWIDYFHLHQNCTPRITRSKLFAPEGET